jgi:HlyD family secretion protein
MVQLMKIILFIILAIVLGSCGDKNGNYDASGTFEATEIMVSAESSGKILELNLREGEHLQKDQVVGAIDSIQVYLHKKQLEHSIGALRSRRPEIDKQIAVLEQQIATQENEKARVERLLVANAANAKQLDDIMAQLAMLKKQLAAQQSSLSIASKGIEEDAGTLRIQVEQADDLLKKCRIVNPVEGTVLVKYARAGEMAVPGKSLYKIANMETLIFRAYITSGQLTMLKPGQKVRVFSDFGDTTREYPGVVEWISEKSEFTPKTIQTQDERANLVYAVKIAVKNDGYLKIGMYGQVDLQTEK